MRSKMVYKLHFWPPYKHAAHYSGKSDRLPERLADHAAGRGARLTQVQIKAGGSWVVGLAEPGWTERERQIKGHDAARYCDVCQALKGLQSGELGEPEALARAGWDRANPYQRELLLEILGIEQAPEQIPERAHEVRPFVPAPQPDVLTEITPELEAVVDALEQGWHREAQAARERELEQPPFVPTPRAAPEPQAQAEITPEIDPALERLPRAAEAEPELEQESGLGITHDPDLGWDDIEPELEAG
jgi:hypothetical protein